MEWLTLAAAKAFIKRAWPLLLLILFGLLVVGALMIQASRERAAFKAGDKAGAARVQKGWDAAVARGKEEIARLDRENAAAEATAKAEGEAIGEKRRRDQADQIASRDRLIADQRAGIVRLRQQWRGCVSQAEGGSSAGGAGGPQPADELRAADAANLVRIADDADSKVKRLQEFVQVQQEFMQRVCPVTLSSR